MKINHMSVSRHGTWQTCHQMYKYKYDLELKPQGDEPFYFTYGKVIHKIAEEYCLSKGERMLWEIANDTLSGKIPLERSGNAKRITLPAEYKQRIPGDLRSMKSLMDRTGTDGTLEMPFEYDLDPPNGKIMTGFIDRLIQRDDQFFILDYKTTRPGPFRKNRRTVLDDLQLRTYARVVQRKFGVPAANVRAALYYLEGGELVGAKFSDESLDAAEAELLKCYDQIVRADPDEVRGTVGRHCDRCDFKAICPFFRSLSGRLPNVDFNRLAQYFPN